MAEDRDRAQAARMEFGTARVQEARQERWVAHGQDQFAVAGLRRLLISRARAVEVRVEVFAEPLRCVQVEAARLLDFGGMAVVAAAADVAKELGISNGANDC